MPGDLQRLFGGADVNMPARRMRCEKCGRKDNMEAEVVLPVAAEQAGMTVPRLADINVRKSGSGAT